jgi:hypothetical protein
MLFELRILAENDDSLAKAGDLADIFYNISNRSYKSHFAAMQQSDNLVPNN